ncbi:MAG: DNA gyrase subunit A [Bacteroidaceae bacterium]|nr:DNA gyrase subunit A [Bacteroidaceae bacterium]MDO5482912.1 DNA gyrase subunit A [Bacteroidaceae bacterium]
MEDLDRIIKVEINETMKKSYIDYSMSVIVARALPEVRDGFKPVHRRILYSMDKHGNTSDKPTVKCARIVGDVLGHLHPHGDASVYGSLVRLAQPWAMRYTLVDGQGNFGSVDGDGAAAMRYTEARLSKIGEAMLQDIEKETVDMTDNFDNSEKEPTVLPTRIPNLLVNGATGIAVGMATNIPTHNLSEVIDGCIAYIDNPDLTCVELMQYIKGPDFPTGGIICGIDGIRDAYETGRGRIVIRSKTEIETEGTHDKIIVSEIPYNVNKSELIKKIAQLVNEKKIDGISNVNDESDREGMRIVIDIKREANANVVRNKLFKMTDLQSTFAVNCIAIADRRPKQLSLKDCIRYFVNHRHDVVIRRTKFDKRKAEERSHILEGLIIASDNIDEVVRIIRAAKNPQEAMDNLMIRFGLDEIQAREIVNMRLRALTGLEQDKLHAEFDELQQLINYLNQILTDPELCKKVMKDELQEVKDKWGDKRKTEIDLTASENFDPEQFYAKEEVVVTVSHLGYIKRTTLTEFHTQARGGIGVKGGSARDKDFIEFIYPANTHNTMMFFTQKGRCFWMKVYNIPEGSRTDKGRAIQNLLNIDSDDKVTAFICIENINDQEWVDSHNLIFCTRQGIVKKTAFVNYSRPRSNGIIAISLNEGDEVVEVLLTSGNDEILIANRNGRAIRFNESTVRNMGRGATGVKAMRLDEDAEDQIVGMIALTKPEGYDEENEENETDEALYPDMPTILVLSEKGVGKRSTIGEYRITNRNGKGVKTINITEKTGKLVAIKKVMENEDIMIINKSGVTIRLAVEDIKKSSRNTQGVKLIDIQKRNDVISSVCVVEHTDESETCDNEASETSETINTQE